MAGAKTSMIQPCPGTSNTTQSKWRRTTRRKTHSNSYSRITLTPSTKAAGRRPKVMATQPPISTKVKPGSTRMAISSSNWRKRVVTRAMKMKLRLLTQSPHQNPHQSPHQSPLQSPHRSPPQLQGQSITLSTDMAMNVLKTVKTRVSAQIIARVMYRGHIVTQQNGTQLTAPADA